MKEALSSSFYKGGNRPAKVKPFAWDCTAGKVKEIPGPFLTPPCPPAPTWASWNWFALSAEPTGKSRGLKFHLVMTESRNLRKETMTYTHSLQSHHNASSITVLHSKFYESWRSTWVQWRVLVHIWVIRAGILLTTHWPKQFLSQKFLLTRLFLFVCFYICMRMISQSKSSTWRMKENLDHLPQKYLGDKLCQRLKAKQVLRKLYYVWTMTWWYWILNTNSLTEVLLLFPLCW